MTVRNSFCDGLEVEGTALGNKIEQLSHMRCFQVIHTSLTLMFIYIAIASRMLRRQPIIEALHRVKYDFCRKT